MSLKKWQRDALYPLYRQHATYLCRVLRTAQENGDIDLAEFASRIPAWRDVATCHEVAINSATGYDIETHENSRGKEHEYVHHPAARKVGRDYRVKLLWTLVEEALAADPELSGYEVYDDLEHAPVEEYRCPFCNALIYRYNMYRIIDGYHEDGTANFHYDREWEFNECCPHAVLFEWESHVDVCNYLDDVIPAADLDRCREQDQYILRNIIDDNYDIYNLDIRVVDERNEYGNLETELFFFDGDWEQLKRAMEWEVARLIVEYEK